MKNIHKIQSLDDKHLAYIWNAVVNMRSKKISINPKYGVMFWNEHYQLWDHWGTYWDQIATADFIITNWQNAGRPIVNYALEEIKPGDRIA